MTFVVTLIVLLIERFFDWSHLRHWSWLGKCERKAVETFPSKSPEWQLAATILPIILITFLLQMLLRHSLYGVGGIVFDLVILLYCLGPQNLWADTFACINLIVQGDAQSALDKLHSSFGVNEMADSSLHRRFVDGIFTQANQRIFAVIFWYFVFGPVGAVAYRLVSVAASHPVLQAHYSAIALVANRVEAMLDWLPIRVLTFTFALGGHFSNVFVVWKKKISMDTANNQVVLTDCGLAALGYNEMDELPVDGSVERHAVALIDRSFVISLVFILMLVILF